MRRVFVLAVLAAGVVAGYGSAAHHLWEARHGGGEACPHAGLHGAGSHDAAPEADGAGPR